VSSTKDFIDAIQVENICLGDHVDSLFKLEQLRFCSSIITALEISLNDPQADFTALRDIRVLLGLLPLVDFYLFRCTYCLCEGPLSIKNSSMTSLSEFFSLTSIAQSQALNGTDYVVYVAGLSFERV
jgi:hypothetical protein